MLTDYGVNIRYPFPMDINESDMKIAIKSAHKVKDCVLAKAKIAEYIGSKAEPQSDTD